jgi:hypothetical protein
MLLTNPFLNKCCFFNRCFLLFALSFFLNTAGAQDTGKLTLSQLHMVEQLRLKPISHNKKPVNFLLSNSPDQKPALDNFNPAGGWQAIR